MEQHLRKLLPAETQMYSQTSTQMLSASTTGHLRQLTQVPESRSRHNDFPRSCHRRASLTATRKDGLKPSLKRRSGQVQPHEHVMISPFRPVYSCCETTFFMRQAVKVSASTYSTRRKGIALWKNKPQEGPSPNYS